MAHDRFVSEAVSTPVAVYKNLLRELVDRRPSGTRLKIAAAIGKHKSFVSQITNPGYPMPVPAKHLNTIFELCHFSPEERRTFLAAYEKAHPDRMLPSTTVENKEVMTVSVPIPLLSNPKRQAQMVKAIRRFASELAAMAQMWDEPENSVRPPTDEGSES